MNIFSFLVVIALVLWLAVTNVTTITLHFFAWEISASVALIIFITFVLGYLIGVLRAVPGMLKTRSLVRKNEQALISVQKERDDLKKEIVSLRTQFNEIKQNKEQV